MNEQCAPECLQNDTNSVSIHILNDDCLRHTFSFLRIADRVRIERVCRRWRILSQDSWYMMKTLDLSERHCLEENIMWGFSHTISADILRNILLKCGRFLTQITISSDLNSSIENIIDSSSDNDTIIDDKSTDVDDKLTIIGELCPNLKSIDITEFTVCKSDLQTLAKNCRNITRLCLGPTSLSMFKCFDNELKDYFKINQNLECLKIKRSYSISGESLLWLPAQTVHTIILNNCPQLKDNHLSIALKKFENLRHLRICHCNYIAKHTLQVVGEHCKNLRELKLAGSFSLVQRADMLYLTRLANLQVLKITHNLKVDDEWLTSLTHQCQQLTCIDISYCDNVTDIGLKAIATLPKLEKLTINYLKNVVGYGLQDMCNLKELHCDYCLSITDHAISMLIKSSPQLQLLNLCGCENITTATIKAVRDYCKSRSNNIPLEMFIEDSSILFFPMKDKERFSLF